MGQANSLWTELCCSFAVLAVVALTYKYINPNGGRVLKIHVIYVGSAVLIIAFLPQTLASYIFTDLTVTLVGAVYPIYRATKAACTPFEGDDKEWLQFWMLGGVLFMLTTWVDDVIATDRGEEVWFGALLALFWWLYFPLTCGSLLAYEHVTEPILGPCFRPLERKMSAAVVGLCQMLTNATHLYFLWFFFVLLPAGSKRGVAVAVGTVYPFVSSVTATATDDMVSDTYWLTYWSVYGCLFLAMDLLETWLGQVPGFYTVVIFTTVYLMLPMFRGAEKVFRNVLVPLAGLEEMLILRDSLQIKKEMLKRLDPNRAAAVRHSIARMFEAEGADAHQATTVRKELKQSWSVHKKVAKAFSSRGKAPKYAKQAAVSCVVEPSAPDENLV